MFVRDSITQEGVFADCSRLRIPPSSAVDCLSAAGVDQVNFSLKATRAIRPWTRCLPTRTDFLQIEQATTQLQSQNQGRLIFSVMLGTNDSAMNGPLGSPVAAGLPEI